jgi:hypothetical protein
MELSQISLAISGDATTWTSIPMGSTIALTVLMIRESAVTRSKI